MIYILIGADGTGKTTLADRLSTQLGYDVVKLSYPKTQEEIDNMFVQYIQLIDSHDNVIFDRFFYCDMVYAPIKGRTSGISLEQQRALETLLLRKHAVIVYCYDTEERIVERLKQRGDDYVTPNEIKAILEGYSKVLRLVNKHIPLLYYKIRDSYAEPLVMFMDELNE